MSLYDRSDENALNYAQTHCHRSSQPVDHADRIFRQGMVHLGKTFKTSVVCKQTKVMYTKIDLGLYNPAWLRG